jgi:hypothetical protein
MSESVPHIDEGQSDDEAWHAGFDVVDFETTPISELPEDDGFQLICPVDGCEHEAEFDHLGEVRESRWTKLSRKDEILTDGTTLKEAYCPVHSIDDTQEMVPELREGLGVPLDMQDQQPVREQDKDEYAAFEFADSEVTSDGFLLTCGCDSCYRQKHVDARDDAEQDGWVSGQMVGILADGQILYKGRCPEHHE